MQSDKPTEDTESKKRVTVQKVLAVLRAAKFTHSHSPVKFSHTEGYEAKHLIDRNSDVIVTYYNGATNFDQAYGRAMINQYKMTLEAAGIICELNDLHPGWPTIHCTGIKEA